MSGRPDDVFDAGYWLAHAVSSLTQARIGYGVPAILLEHLCFHAQQAVEKALKAVLVARGIDFPKTHSIPRLLTLLESSGAAIPDQVKRGMALTGYAVQSRYPGGPVVTDADYQEALKTGEYVVAWAEKQIAPRA